MYSCLDRWRGSAATHAQARQIQAMAHRLFCTRSLSVGVLHWVHVTRSCKLRAGYEHWKQCWCWSYHEGRTIVKLTLGLVGEQPSKSPLQNSEIRTLWPSQLQSVGLPHSARLVAIMLEVVGSDGAAQLSRGILTDTDLVTAPFECFIKMLESVGAQTEAAGSLQEIAKALKTGLSTDTRTLNWASLVWGMGVELCSNQAVMLLNQHACLKALQPPAHALLATISHFFSQLGKQVRRILAFVHTQESLAYLHTPYPQWPELLSMTFKKSTTTREHACSQETQCAIAHGSKDTARRVLGNVPSQERISQELISQERIGVKRPGSSANDSAPFLGPSTCLLYTSPSPRDS
eukprot:TRINITY_DN15206_c0_g1_i5.p1 TRINITY_DN15206_c0_g1~~TRINITY_DN15206_c0_g1_i5.p1  ORF type:complete len:348 (-),score=57.87 TRINITY_DN15206_c0_g1_i5:138-1181(-)